MRYRTLNPGTIRSYVDLRGNQRELVYSHALPYTVAWHIKKQPCVAHIWLDNGYPLQIPVKAWSGIKFTDSNVK